MNGFWHARGLLLAQRANRHDVIKKRQTTKLPPARNVLRPGFVPLADRGPMVTAQELGFFCKYGLRVTRSRELGWATIRARSSAPTFLKRQRVFAVQLPLVMKMTPTPKSNSRPLERAPLDTTTKPAVDS